VGRYYWPWWDCSDKDGMARRDRDNAAGCSEGEGWWLLEKSRLVTRGPRGHMAIGSWGVRVRGGLAVKVSGGE
jgi:hypothetical protein